MAEPVADGLSGSPELTPLGLLLPLPQELPLVALGIGPCPSTGLYIDIGVQSVAAACGVDPTCEASPGMEPCPGTSCDVAYVCYDGESCDPLGGAEINATAGMPGDGAVTTEAFRCQVLKAVHPDAYDADLVVGMGFTFYDPMMTVSGMFPEKDFAIIDAAYDPPIPNVEAFYYTEDQVGFLAGVAMCEVAKKLGGDKVGLIGGIPIPPVKKFINGAVVGCYDVLPEATIYVEYGESFNNMDNEGVKMAQDMEAEGVSVVFAAGGGTGSEGLKHLAANGIYVIGVDVDEYVTTFGNGTVDGSEYVLTSALKKVDVGIVDAVNCFLYDWESCAGKNNMMSAANDGVGMAPCHEVRTCGRRAGRSGGLTEETGLRGVRRDDPEAGGRPLHGAEGRRHLHRRGRDVR